MTADLHPGTDRLFCSLFAGTPESHYARGSTRRSPSGSPDREQRPRGRRSRAPRIPADPPGAGISPLSANSANCLDAEYRAKSGPPSGSGRGNAASGGGTRPNARAEPDWAQNSPVTGLSQAGSHGGPERLRIERDRRRMKPPTLIPTSMQRNAGLGQRHRTHPRRPRPGPPPPPHRRPVLRFA